MQQAAENAQEARQAQQEAMSGKPAAAAEAARALQQAAQAIDAATQQRAANTPPGDPSQSHAANAEPGNEPGHEPGNEPGKGNHPGAKPSQTTDPHGIDITGIARVDSRPESVREVGISAGDWAKLPPLVQQQLLNASQQSGPPGYQEKIKNYFVKIAKIQAEGN
jgi:hypothetical protein